MFVTHDLTKTYAPHDAPALAGVSHAFPPGRTTVLLGPSGCGKSTLLRCLLHLIEPTSGRVTLDGRPVADDVTALRRRVGYVIQDGGLFPHLTAAGNVTLLAKRLDRVNPARLTALAELTRLDPALLDKYPGELSGGQRQRVALMRALYLDPAALLLDEPLGALDPITRADLQTDLRQIFRDLGKTVAMVTHDLAEARYFADEIVLMQSGRIVQRGTYDDLVTAPADTFVERFVNAQRTIHGEVA